ncbi:MAG: hypothetical protein IKE01_02745 [Clostridia bacterium]|nr:hypothetical protein [Clostridia bacterium]
MVVNSYAIGFKETLHYLKGIRQEDVDKISPEFIEFMNENADKDYVCNFDYTKSLSELDVKDATRAIISFICLKFWCESQEEKEEFVRALTEHEADYKNELEKKYNYYSSSKEQTIDEPEEKQEENQQTCLIKQDKQSWISKLFAKIRNFFKIK